MSLEEICGIVTGNVWEIFDGHMMRAGILFIRVAQLRKLSSYRLNCAHQKLGLIRSISLRHHSEVGILCEFNVLPFHFVARSAERVDWNSKFCGSVCWCYVYTCFGKRIADL